MQDVDLEVDAEEDTIPDAGAQKQRAPRRRRYQRRRRALDIAPYRRLFRLLTRLRAASPDALDELFFKSAFPRQSKRNNRRMIAALVDAGLLAKMRLPYARVIYHLTRKSLATVEADGIAIAETLRRAPSEEIGGCRWLRSSLHAELARDGFTIGRGPAELFALRRFLLDTKQLTPHVAAAIRADVRLAPPAVASCVRCATGGVLVTPGSMRMVSCAKCERRLEERLADAVFVCSACREKRPAPGPHRLCDEPLMEEHDCVDVDVAWRIVGHNKFDVRVLFVEHPTRSLATQLDELPMRHIGAPKVPIILRSTDADSRFDRASGEWIVKGPRHQQLDRAFSDEGWPGFFSFAKTTTVVELAPALQLHVMRSGAPAPAWECGAPWAGRSKYGGRGKEDREREREREHDRERQRERAQPDERAGVRERRVDGLPRDDARPIDFAALRERVRVDAVDAARVVAAQVDARPAAVARERVDVVARERVREDEAREVARADDERGGGMRRR